MWLYFNSNGQLTTILEHGSPARAGSTQFKIFAVFEGIDNIDKLRDYSATIKLKKPDLTGSEYPTLLMELATAEFEKLPNETNTGDFENLMTYYGFLFDFGSFNDNQEEEVLLDTQGLWEAVITLIKDDLFVQGVATFNVGGIGTEQETSDTIVYEIVTNQIVHDLNQRALKTQVIIVVESFDNINLSDYEVGQLLLQKGDEHLYKIVEEDDIKRVERANIVIDVIDGLVFEQFSCTASGTKSSAFGNTTTASGNNSLAEGQSTIASGENSHAEGNYSTASGKDSHTEGQSCVASGIAAHAGGSYSTASGDVSFAQGFENTVSCWGGVALGRNLTSSAYGGCEVVLGQYNDYSNDNVDNPQLVVGVGADGDHRANGLVVYRDGRVAAGATPTNNNDLTTKKYVDDNVQEVREVAAGRCASYSLSYNASAPSLMSYSQYKYIDDSGDIQPFESYDEMVSYMENLVMVNSRFNTQNDNLYLTPYMNTTDYILIKDNDGNNIVAKINQLYKILKIGDNMYVTETQVPDRWISSTLIFDITFSRLETSKRSYKHTITGLNYQSIPFTLVVISKDSTQITNSNVSESNLFGVDTTNTWIVNASGTWKVLHLYIAAYTDFPTQIVATTVLMSGDHDTLYNYYISIGTISDAVTPL